MKTNYKILLGVGFLFLLFTQSVDAQILQTRSEIIEEYGTPFYTGTTKSRENFLYYKIPVKTATSGTYDQRRVLFLKTSEDGTETCFKWKILEPSSETAYNIASFTRDLVQIDDKKWKDYSKGIIYQVEEVKGVCKISAWYDNEIGLARVYKF